MRIEGRNFFHGICGSSSGNKGRGSKRCGWMGECRARYGRINRTAALVVGCVFLLAGKIVRWICGSPWGSLAALRLGDTLPSFFWMSFLWSIWYFVLGATFGAVMFDESCAGVIRLRTVEKYRGGMYFVAMILLGFLWYPLFFVLAHFYLATLICLVVTLLAILTAICYLRFSRLAGGVLLLHAIFLVALSLWSLWIVFCA